MVPFPDFLLLAQLLAQPLAHAASTTLTVSLPAKPREVNPLIMGCHSDSGFAVEPFGFESQMIVGESFEVTGRTNWSGVSTNISWNHRADGDALFAFDNATAFHGQASQKISMSSGTYAAVTNRGLNNEGLVLHAGQVYTGYVFAKAIKPITLIVALADYTAMPEATLAAVELKITSTDWVKYNFSLMPNRSSTCKFIPFGSDPEVTCFNFSTVGHACQKCGGEFSLSISNVGDSVNLDFAALHPGEWGRYAGLEIRKDAVEVLHEMGVTAIRQVPQRV
jgi:hypothetical protein